MDDKVDSLNHLLPIITKSMGEGLKFLNGIGLSDLNSDVGPVP